jgi:hypothetical protein
VDTAGLVNEWNEKVGVVKVMMKHVEEGHTDCVRWAYGQTEKYIHLVKRKLVDL